MSAVRPAARGEKEWHSGAGPHKLVVIRADVFDRLAADYDDGPWTEEEGELLDRYGP